MSKRIHPTKFQTFLCFIGWHKWQYWGAPTGQVVVKFCERCPIEKRVDKALWNID